MSRSRASDNKVVAGGSSHGSLGARTLASSTDVVAASAGSGDLLISDGAGRWIAKPNPSYTKVEVDAKISTLVIGLEHGEAVQSIINDPPATPVADEFFIVGSAPTGAWVGHTNSVTWWDGTAWQFQVPQAGEAHLVESVGEIWHWNASAWVKVANASTTGGPASAGELCMIGEIKQSFLTEPEFKTMLGAVESLKWVLCDGRDVTGSKFAQTTGLNNVPDLRGAYLRCAGQNASNTAWNGGALRTYQEDTTARPRNTAFTTDNPGNHDHGIAANWNVIVTEKGGHDLAPGGGGNPEGNFHLAPDGAHTHTITGGGDTETRPKSFAVNYFLKIN